MLALIILGALLQVVGLVGCVLPWLAGPPFNFIGLLLLSIARHGKAFSHGFLIVMAVLTALTLVLDYAMPLAGTRRFGATKRGFWGALIGMAAGALALPPFGLVLGAFHGAVAGELSAGRDRSEEILRTAAAITARYSDAKHAAAVAVTIFEEGAAPRAISVAPAADADIQLLILK